MTARYLLNSNWYAAYQHCHQQFEHCMSLQLLRWRCCWRPVEQMWWMLSAPASALLDRSSFMRGSWQHPPTAACQPDNSGAMPVAPHPTPCGLLCLWCNASHWGCITAPQSVLTCEAARTWRHRAAAGHRGSKVCAPKPSWRLPLLGPLAVAAGRRLHGHAWPEGLLLGRPWLRCKAARWRHPSRAHLPAQEHGQQPMSRRLNQAEQQA